MSPSKSRIVRITIIALVTFVTLFLTGRRLQKLYGLDPPYVYFWIGSVLELAALLVPGVTVIWLLAVFWRFRRSS